ncbi:hypothetical protein [Leucobacter aridicollis]|uniref:hypothetical protein n=1 Tax=Leucobacter aridicollis TaxID=283878 RepID=UPI0021042E22|nr:hypothetical protein [Leucobacter aridicollis]UTX53310.1 hypothetical protein KI794_00630 [Leucobacter aridicollis]
MNLILELLEGMASEAVETGLSFAGVVIRWVFFVWASVAVILVARWMLGLEFKMTAIRLGTDLTGALGIFWAGATALLSLNSHVATMREGRFVEELNIEFTALGLNMFIGTATIVALTVHFYASISLAERRTQNTDSGVALGGAL